MVKRLKLRLSRVIASLHSTCKSKDPSDLPEVPLPPEPTPPLFMLSPVNPKARDIDFPVPPRPHKLQAQSQSHHKRHLSSILCGCRPKPGSSYSPSPDATVSSPRDAFGWKQESKWHVVARVQQLEEEEEEPPRRKLYNSSVTDESEGGISPCPPPEKMKKKKKKLRAEKQTKKRNLKCSRGRFSTSSADSRWFSSDGEEEEEEEEEKENETETLVSSSRTFSSSSRTLSTDSSTDFGTHHLETIRENPTDTNLQRKKKKKKKKKKKTNVKMVKKVNQRCPLKHSSPSRTGKISACGSSESESPARFSTVFKRLMPCKIEGKVRESFAVVKKSEDPYEDFKRSMLEMIVANQMFDIRDLEQLLHCFLTLNSKHHHAVIVEAFSDIWEILFCK